MKYQSVEHAVEDLYLTTKNDGDLYRSDRKRLEEKLSRMWKNDTTEETIRGKAIRGYTPIVLESVRKYVREFCPENSTTEVFPQEIVDKVVDMFIDDFFEEARLGNFVD